MPTQANRVTAKKLGPDLSYLAVIEKLITAIGQETNKKRILGPVLPYALTVSGTDVGALLVTGDTANSFRAVVQRGLSKEIVRQLTTGDLSNLLLVGQRLWMKPQPVQINPDQSLLSGHHLRYLFGLPLRFGGRVLGAIVIGSSRQEYHSLTPVQQQRLATIAHLVALFLDDLRLRTQNASLNAKPVQGDSAAPPEAAAMAEYEHDLEQLLAAVMTAEEEVANQNVDLGLLNNLSTKMIGTMPLNVVLDTAIKQTLSAMQSEAAWCYLWQDGHLVMQGCHGLSENYIRNMQYLSPGNGAEGMAFTRREAIFRDAVLFHSGQMRRFVQEEGLVSVAATPLFANGEPFGVLAVGNRANREWSARDHRMLVSIGQRVELAIASSKMVAVVQEEASVMEDRYQELQQSNVQLARRAKELEQEVDSLREAGEQIWRALAASQFARRNNITSDSINENLITSLERALVNPPQDQTYR